MALDAAGLLLQALSVVVEALGMIKVVFSGKERERLHALGPGQVRAAIFLGLTAWSVLSVFIGCIIYAFFVRHS